MEYHHLMKFNNMGYHHFFKWNIFILICIHLKMGLCHTYSWQYPILKWDYLIMKWDQIKMLLSHNKMVQI